MDYIIEIEKILKSIKDIPKKDFNSIKELLENNEFGIALEMLCVLIEFHNLAIQKEEFIKIKQICQEIGIDDYYWLKTQNKIKNIQELNKMCNKCKNNKC